MPTDELMIRGHWRYASRIFATLALFALGAVPASVAGTLEGRVYNTATGNGLEKARVVVDGAEHTVLTEPDGTFRVRGLGDGSHQVTVSFLGFGTHAATVTVGADGVTQQDFGLTRSGVAEGTEEEIIELAAFQVVAEREMTAQAMAMNEQRFAPNIKNVVAVDEYGDRGDENIGEFLRFLPGVAMNDAGHVPNEIVLRGFPANNSSMMVDGGEIVGARGGNTRTVSLLEVPMGNVSRVEVTKVPTPDMPASGLGGSINLITKNGFEATKSKFSYKTYFLFHSNLGLTFDGGPVAHVPGTSPSHIQPSYNLSYLNPLTKSFAISMNLSSTWRQKPMDYGDDADESATWHLVDGYQRSSTWQSLAQVLKTNTVQLGADWRITPRDILSASVQYRESDSYITRSYFQANYGTGATGDATYTQGASNGVGTATQGAGANQDIVTETNVITLKYEHRGDLWKLNFSGSYSDASADYTDISNGHFNTTPATITSLVIRGDGIPGGKGELPRVYTAVNRSGSEIDLYDGGNYSLVSGVSQESKYVTSKKAGRIDLTRELDGIRWLKFRTGVSVDQTERDQRRFLQTWNFRPNGASTATARLAGNFDVFDDEYNATAPNLYGVATRWISPLKVYELYEEHPDWFVLNDINAHQDLVNNSRHLIETISAGYLRFDLSLLKNRLNVVTGVRYERTDAEGWGPLNDPTARYLKDENGDLILDEDGDPIYLSDVGLERARQRYKERGTHAKRDYDGLYPSVNASFELTDSLILRASYARTIGRPNVNQIIPGSVIGEPADLDAGEARSVITVSNTGLIPWTADSFDLSLESYQFKDGFGSIGVFQKDIKNFFARRVTEATPELLELYGLPTDEFYLDYDISTMVNAGDARITGLEFAYRQNLTFFPDWARGFQVFFNGTWMSLSGNNASEFTGFNPSSFSGGVNFIRSRYAIKLTCTHQGETRRSLVSVSTANGIPEGTYDYQAERTRWDLSAEYSFSRHLSVFGSMTDLTGEFDGSTLRYAPNTPSYAKVRRFGKTASYITLGVKGSF